MPSQEPQPGRKTPRGSTVRGTARRRRKRSSRALTLLMVLGCAAGLYLLYGPATQKSSVDSSTVVSELAERGTRPGSSPSPAPAPGNDPSPPSSIPASAYPRSVERIVDGDTIRLRGGTRVRLHGIDTPEYDQPYGRQATRELDRLLGSTVYLDSVGVDDYGRVLAVLWTPEGVNVNVAMVCAGAAWWYRYYAPDDRDSAQCEAQARAKRLGLWRQGNPEAPWNWRRRQRR